MTFGDDHWKIIEKHINYFMWSSIDDKGYDNFDDYVLNEGRKIDINLLIGGDDVEKQDVD